MCTHPTLTLTSVKLTWFLIIFHDLWYSVMFMDSWSPIHDHTCMWSHEIPLPSWAPMRCAGYVVPKNMGPMGTGHDECIQVPSCFMALLSPPTSLHDVIIPSSRFTIVTVVKAEWHQKWKERKAQRVVHESMKPTSTYPLFFSLPLFQTNIVLQKNSQAWGWGNGSIFCVIFFVDMAIPLKLDLFCNQSPRMTNAVFVAACCAKNSCSVTTFRGHPPRHGCNKTKPSLPTSTSVGPVSISRGSTSFCWEMLDNIISWNSNDEISQLKQPYPGSP